MTGISLEDAAKVADVLECTLDELANEYNEKIEALGIETSVSASSGQDNPVRAGEVA